MKNQTAATTDVALLIARVGIGLLMLVHGIPKLEMLLSATPAKFPPVLGMSAELSLGLAVFAEFFCSLLVIVGLGTRLAVVPLMITMAIAALHIHAADPFSVQEMSIHFLLVYVILMLTGGGRYSLDYLIQQKRLTRAATARNL